MDPATPGMGLKDRLSLEAAGYTRIRQGIKLSGWFRTPERRCSRVRRRATTQLAGEFSKKSVIFH